MSDEQPPNTWTDKTVTHIGPLAPDTMAPGAPGDPISMPQRFGEYEILAEVARGGMGIVYRARQVDLDRIVALKMVLAGKLANEEDFVRFRTEAEAAARLQHPHIVTVHDVGDVDGQQFFSMEFIDGTSLARRLFDGPLPSRDSARIMQKVAKAMAFAHDQGILHRDLKPSNIMIDQQDEPRITDFGLAKRLDNDSGQTRTGAVLGTPSYMAPEQAAGRGRVGKSADVYGLGAVLYEMLTGRPPFRSETAFDTVMQVMHDDPAPPSLLNPKVDPDLETICLKCLEKDPRDRYASAEALARDLQRYLDGDSINARSFSLFDRLTRILDRSQHDVAFRAWSSMLFVLAGVVLAEHFIVFLLIRFDQPRSLIFAARFTQFVILAGLFWYNRGNQILPTTAAERELWTIWIGFFLAYASCYWLLRLLFRIDIIQGDPGSHVQELLPYPFFSILAGLAFFIMGCNYWGRCYAMGGAFLLLGLTMPWYLDWAPLAFGLLWALCLTTFGGRLRRHALQADAEKARLAQQAPSPD